MGGKLFAAMVLLTSCAELIGAWSLELPGSLPWHSGSGVFSEGLCRWG